MTCEAIIKKRGIKELLHFTTSKGLLGILDARSIKARSLLKDDERLEYILNLNSSTRKDLNWLNYVNLSISKINSSFFRICSEKWHKNQDFWWCILSLDPSLVTRDGVYFATTNNIYTSVKRATGPSALESLFAPVVEQWPGREVHRTIDMPPHQPTCEQAEVLFPHSISTSNIQKIYVQTDGNADEVAALFSAVSHEPPEIIIDQSKFI